MPESNVPWEFVLLAATQDKKTSRSGVDGNAESGLRPSPGFKRVYELSFLPNANHDLTSVVLDFYPVQFSIGSRGYSYGFVYRVKRSVASGAAVANVFL